MDFRKHRQNADKGKTLFYKDMSIIQILNLANKGKFHKNNFELFMKNIKNMVLNGA